MHVGGLIHKSALVSVLPKMLGEVIKTYLSYNSDFSKIPSHSEPHFVHKSSQLCNESHVTAEDRDIREVNYLLQDHIILTLSGTGVSQ